MTRAGAPDRSDAGGDPRGHHDWQSREYVSAWIADYDGRVEARRPQFDLLADLIPHPNEAPIRILDVGAGWGPVTSHVLGRFPNAQALLLDYSDVMLEEARRRLVPLGERVDFVRGDLSQAGAIEVAAARSGPFDAIVSSLCIHNLRPVERVAALFGELRAVTARGGCFLNADLVGSARLVQDAWRLAQTRRALRTGREPQAWRREREGTRPPDAAGAQPASRSSRTLVDHLRWLSEAGFDGVDCFWRDGRQAVYGGFVSAEGS